jgi:hypothetical protein
MRLAVGFFDVWDDAKRGEGCAAALSLGEPNGRRNKSGLGSSQTAPLLYSVEIISFRSIWTFEKYR